MDLRRLVFRSRGVIPIPFVIVCLIGARFEPVAFVGGLLAAVAGELIRIRAVMFAGGATRTRRVGAPELVTEGPFACTRNPLYHANLLIYVGYVVATFAYFPYLQAAVLVFFSVQYAVIISLEEETLERLFGESYREYCRKVPSIYAFRCRSGSKTKPRFTLFETLRDERSTLIGFGVLWVLLILRLLFL